jgi:hypothetical protein
MNIRILAASALALAILVPAANAASRQHERSAASSASDIDHCPNNNMNLGTLECLPIRAKVVHARVVKHVVKPVTAFERMTENVISHDENVSH